MVTNNQPAARIIDARIATLVFPLDNDISDRRVVAYFLAPTKH